MKRLLFLVFMVSVLNAVIQHQFEYSSQNLNNIFKSVLIQFNISTIPTQNVIPITTAIKLVVSLRENRVKVLSRFSFTQVEVNLWLSWI